MGPNRLRRLIGTAVALAAAGGVIVDRSVTIDAHGRDARYIEELGWQKPNLTRVFAASRSELGLSGSKVKSRSQSIDGQACVVASLIAFDVDDRFAFDVDEPVDLTLTYAPSATTTPFAVAWDKNGGEGYGVTPDQTPESGSSMKTMTIRLERARLSGQGVQKADIAIAARNGGVIALCDVAIARPAPAAAATPGGAVHLSVTDGVTGRAVAARVGLYDATGRIPLPSNDAVAVHRFADEARLQWMNQRTFWPSPNRQAFYVNGVYDAELPAGTYDLIVARGPEYRLTRRQIEVKAGAPTPIAVALERYDNLPAAGWYSADSHIHLMRDQPEDQAVWAQLSAEDVHLGNLLEMGNILGTYFKQPVWGSASRFVRDGYAMVAGQEDPRTGMRGHTIHWNLKEHVHTSSDAFFHYDRVFENTRRQGALTGYAHLGDSFNGRRGLALDVPFGLIDFIEVLQGGRLNTEVWYSFLNLGYRITPAAGADYPYFGPTLPGVERTFAKLEGEFTPDRWYDAFRQGHAYVTNGPLLTLTVNGQPMGAELHVKRGERLQIAAAAALNPDVDALDRLELVVLGDVAETVAAAGRDRVTLQRGMVADHSMWIAVRAYGGHQAPPFTTIAHTAPIYVVVGEEPTWKREAVAGLVDYQRGKLNELLTVPIDPNSDLEAWETGDTLVDQWPRQLPQLKPRIQEADRRYQQLLDRMRLPTNP
jgi:hypothetical protein